MTVKDLEIEEGGFKKTKQLTKCADFLNSLIIHEGGVNNFVIMHSSVRQDYNYIATVRKGMQTYLCY